MSASVAVLERPREVPIEALRATEPNRPPVKPFGKGRARNRAIWLTHLLRWHADFNPSANFRSRFGWTSWVTQGEVLERLTALTSQGDWTPDIASIKGLEYPLPLYAHANFGGLIADLTGHDPGFPWRQLNDQSAFTLGAIETDTAAHFKAFPNMP